MTVTAAQALLVATDFGVDLNPATLRKWVQRGKVRRYGRDSYDSDDIAREVQRHLGMRPTT